jgi:hypothetical protein
MEFRYVAKSAGQTIWARQTIAAARAMIEEEEVAAMFAELLRTLGNGNQNCQKLIQRPLPTMGSE